MNLTAVESAESAENANTQRFGPRALRRRILAAERRTDRSAASGDQSPASGAAVWAPTHHESPDHMVVSFCAGRDVTPRPAVDAELVLYDIWTNAAHTLMLERQGILRREHALRIMNALRELEDRYVSGGFQLDPALEDVHMNIERAVGEAAGHDVAGRMHTGRSRNDQSATDMRLWLRDRLLEIELEVHGLVDVLLRRAAQWTEIPMPGYSHQQPGMVSSLGYWAGAHAQALLRDVQRFRQAYELVDMSPLGSAAGFGTSWPLDRQFTAHLLGFVDVQRIGLDCVTNRWEAEATAMQATAFLMTHLSVMAQDIMTLTSPPRRFLLLPERFTTGSSIMPQKRNPDFAEVIRAKAAHVQAQLQALFGAQRALSSGYNRDSQWTKYAVMDGMAEARYAPSVLASVLDAIEPDSPAMLKACHEGFLNAVEIADYLCRRFNLDFRTCYRVLGGAVQECRAAGVIDKVTVEKHLAASGTRGVIPHDDWAALTDPTRLLASRQIIGSPAPAQLAESLRYLSEHLEESRRAHARHVSWLDRCAKTIRELHRAIGGPDMVSSHNITGS